MKLPISMGTRSVLAGAHCFLVHPFFVAAAWAKLYGAPRDWRLWLLFFVHDLGYFGKPEIDGPKGKTHPEFGANIMHRICDSWRVHEFTKPSGNCWKCNRSRAEVDLAKPLCNGYVWRNIALFHSRDYARAHNHPISRLCVADKYATVLTPSWLYLPMVRLTGELKEYMRNAENSNSPHFRMFRYTRKPIDWHRGLKAYLHEWVAGHEPVDLAA